MTPRDVLDFWFGELDGDGRADEAHRKRWWKKDPDFDATIRSKFLDVYERIAGGELEDWRDTAKGALAYVIVLDQFSRNMFRDRARMYAADHLAVTATQDAVARGFDHALGPAERTFLYMPLMHAEELEAQQTCVRLFEQMHEQLEGAAAASIAGNIDYAKQHRDIVERFGRFPHRNAILDRPTTDEEAAFLTQPGSSF